MEYYKKNMIDAMYGMFEPMLRLNDKLTRMKEEYHSTSLDKKSEWNGAFFDDLQYEEIQKGLNAGLNAVEYAKPEYSAITMSLMRSALMAGVDISPILGSNKQFSDQQIALLVVAGMTGENMELIAHPELEPDRMRARLIEEYVPEDMPDMKISIEDMHEYGYMDDYVMLPLLAERAEELYTSYDIYMLYRDGTEALAEHRGMIKLHAEHGGIFGIEKPYWKRELALDKQGLERAEPVRDTETDIQRVQSEDESNYPPAAVFIISDRCIEIHKYTNGYAYTVYDDFLREINSFTYHNMNSDMAMEEALSNIISDMMQSNDTGNRLKGHISADDKPVMVKDYDEIMNEINRYGRIVPDYVRKTRAGYKPIMGHDMYDVEAVVQEYFYTKIGESGLQIEMIDIAICGSRSRGLEHGLSDLDVVIEYDTVRGAELKGTVKEDTVFNVLHEDDFRIGGVVIDINPITATESGTIQDYLIRAEAYLTEKAEQREQEQIRFSGEVDSVLEGTYSRHDALKVCDTPDILSAAGCKKLPMLYTQRHLRNAVGVVSDSKAHNHSLNVSQIKKLPELLRDPVMVMDSISRDDSLVVVTEQLDNARRPVIVIIRPNGEGVYEVNPMDTNFITSVYGKDNICNFITNEVNQGKILYWNKNKSQALFSVLQLQLPQGLNNLDSNIILHKSSNIVNGNEIKKEGEIEKKVPKGAHHKTR